MHLCAFAIWMCRTHGMLEGFGATGKRWERGKCVLQNFVEIYFLYEAPPKKHKLTKRTHTHTPIDALSARATTERVEHK